MEVLVVIAGIVVLAALFLPAFAASERKAQRIHCLNNLVQIGLATRVWEGDHFNHPPMQASETNNGTIELLSADIPASQLVLWNFLVMSNELTTPYILHCPSDERTTAVKDFNSGFGNTNISYFVNPAGSEDNPQMIFTGDDNLATNGTPVSSGLLNLTTNTTVTWTADCHYRSGNIGLADGSVQQVREDTLQHALQPSGTNTTRLAIP